ncbi:MAG: hypothetical protein AAGF12_21820 [Myxococcota bacterium]
MPRFSTPARFFIIALVSLGCGGDGDPAASRAAFAELGPVFQHPRCINCHPSDAYPRQGDEGQRHFLNVERGPENHGLPGMRCGTCHQDANQEHAGIPGAPHWGLPPLSQGWQGLTVREICEAIKDRSRNGARSLDAIEVHLVEDPLVAWAWNPGGDREPPPIEYAEFQRLARVWADNGGHCPE